MTFLQSAREHYAGQQEVTADAVATARRLRFDSLGRLVAVVAGFQAAAAVRGARYVPEALAEQGLDTDRFATPDARTLAGWTSYGLPLAPLLDKARAPLVDSYRFDRLIASQVQDAGRNGEVLQMSVTPSVTTYVRMLNPPSCSRCVLLAGKKYGKNDGFARHPLCDCTHVPTDDELGDDVRFDAPEYFRSLPTAEQLAEEYPHLTVKMRREAGIYSQEDIFTKHGAELIRAAPDSKQQYVMGRVVNTRWMKHSTAGEDKMRRAMPGDLVQRAGGDRVTLLRLMRSNGYIRY